MNTIEIKCVFLSKIGLKNEGQQGKIQQIGEGYLSSLYSLSLMLDSQSRSFLDPSNDIGIHSLFNFYVW